MMHQPEPGNFWQDRFGPDRDGLILLAGVIIVVIVTLALIIHRVRRRSALIEEPLAPTTNRCSFVRERVERYRDEMLRYEIGLERHRRNASREELDRVLDGAEAVNSMPILYLNSEEWMWEDSQLRIAVEGALNHFGLRIPADKMEPTRQAAQACEEWAAEEAKHRFDQLSADRNPDET